MTARPFWPNDKSVHRARNQPYNVKETPKFQIPWKRKRHGALAASPGSARVVQHGIKIVWGYNAAPKLPDTWRIERNPEAAALAVSPDGNEYLIGDGVLYPYLKCPPEGLPLSSLKPGQRYIDVVKAIKVP